MTAVTDLQAAPVDVGAAASFSAGNEYLIEPLDTAIVVVETSTAAPPASGARGHHLHPATARRPADVRVYKAAAGRWLWAWTKDGQPGRLVWSEA